MEHLPINSEIRDCDTCQLRAIKGQGIGNPQARILLLAQNPGRVQKESNLTFIPFEWHLWNDGAPEMSGAILRRIIRAVEIPEYDLYVTNTQKCRGKVTKPYIENCSHWLEKELRLLPRLKLIVAMGLVAGARIGNIQTLHLDWYHDWMTVYVSHPAALLYPGGISFERYEDQWRFVAAVYRKLKEETHGSLHSM